MDNNLQLEKECSTCNGCGKIANKACPVCNGTGTVLTADGLQVLKYLRDSIRVSEH
ncbi:tryptophan RNA-binding attenuation protein [Sporomusa termitida]|uniref:Tryptophan RNA-binding attenuator protein inhibitory protein n=1 Tax=Sporomusa termitida TaxID=2377 RepID=A0A517DT30_9FIRM|nr:Tryptophan RNA-binding attenuator protein inhibitory protein [Sporomusa termitida]